jgi:hypothetical protein
MTLTNRRTAREPQNAAAPSPFPPIEAYGRIILAERLEELS